MLRKMLIAPLAATLMLALAGCGSDSHEKVVDDAIAAMQELVDVLKTVDDEESAEAAKAKVEKIAAKMKKIGERYEALGEPDEATTKAIEEEYNPKMERLVGELPAQMMKLMKYPELAKTVQDAMGQMPK
jgi:hypothetical protein